MNGKPLHKIKIYKKSVEVSVTSTLFLLHTQILSVEKISSFFTITNIKHRIPSCIS